MTRAMVTTLTMTIRMCGVAAFCLGLAQWMQTGIPLQFHAAVGCIVVLALLGLGLLARGRGGWLSPLAVLWALCIPLTGAMVMILPVQFQMEELQPVLRVLHMSCAVGGIAVGELLSRRARQGENPG
ncbi:MAG: hypothetical protein F8N37_11630 [Telmatospirillum sp.]|nr:hypothetical protein [Telmatospirillum sp.]